MNRVFHGEFHDGSLTPPLPSRLLKRILRDGQERSWTCFLLSKPMANLPAPPQERSDTADGFEQSRVFNKRHGCAGLLGFRDEKIGQGRLPRFFALRSAF